MQICGGPLEGACGGCSMKNTLAAKAALVYS
jgi:hypothetical protein